MPLFSSISAKGMLPRAVSVLRASSPRSTPIICSSASGNSTNSRTGAMVSSRLVVHFRLGATRSAVISGVGVPRSRRRPTPVLGANAITP